MTGYSGSTPRPASSPNTCCRRRRISVACSSTTTPIRPRSGLAATTPPRSTSSRPWISPAFDDLLEGRPLWPPLFTGRPARAIVGLIHQRPFGISVRRSRRPVRKVANEQAPAPAIERVIECETLGARCSDLDAEADDFVVHEIGDLRPSAFADFTKRSVSFVRIGLPRWRLSLRGQRAGDCKML